MTIKEIIESGGNVQVVVNATDLKEFALDLISEAKLHNARQPEEKAYTPTEFAQKHNVDKSTLWRWCKAGILTPTRVGGKVFYYEKNLMKGGRANV